MKTIFIERTMGPKAISKIARPYSRPKVSGDILNLVAECFEGLNDLVPLPVRTRRDEEAWREWIYLHVAFICRYL